MERRSQPQRDIGYEATRGHHDWLSTSYVKDWIENDVTNDADRRPIIRQMLTYAPFPRDAKIKVLDVGAGYGLLSHEALCAFPNAHVTLQDYSEPMFVHAKNRLAEFKVRTAYMTADFSKPGWAKTLGGPFDVAISGIAIHNLGDPRLVEQVYQELATVIKPGGVFLDLDYTFGGLALPNQLRWLKGNGFTKVETPWKDGSLVMFVARR